MTLHKKLFGLQNVLYAENKHPILIILKGMDTAGKDGVIRHVFSCVNPMGCNVKSFKAPINLPTKKK
jgi:polyphosphate kinase 2 (PPK2 family)